MRQARGDYGGTRWTPLAKGGPNDSESPEACSRREAREELGALVEIVARLPGWFLGTTTATGVFVARLVAPLGPHDDETAAVVSATFDDAALLVALSPSQIVQRRDLAVLDAVRRHLRALD